VRASGSKGILAGAGRLEVAFDEEGEFGFVQGAQAEADAEALGERGVLGFGEPLVEQRLADEDEGEGAAAIEVIGGEQPEVFEGVVGPEMTLVDQEDGALGQAAEVGDQGGGRRTLEACGAEPAERGDVGEEAEGADSGQGHGKAVIAGGGEAFGKEGEDGALATAALGDEAGDGIAVQREAEVFEDRVEGGGPQQRGLGRRFGERGVTQAEVLFEGGPGGADPCLVRSRTRCAVSAAR
jgi:hypothetical protein